MIENILFGEIIRVPYKNDAILRNDFPGFKEDYLALHCLIKKHRPLSFMEIGTSVGLGTRIICNAMKKSNSVYSLDVPPGTDPQLIYPEGEDKHPGIAGKYCEFAYNQIYGDSRNFDFKKYYPLEGWFIDGKHRYSFVKNDSLQAFKSRPKLIVWHDTQINEVKKAITETAKKFPKYKTFLIDDTRIAFAIL